MSQQPLPSWMLEFRDRLPSLVRSLETGGAGQYRLCASGDFLRPGPAAGLGFSCFAAKTLLQFGVWDTLPALHKAAWIAHIQGFQLDAASGGMFRDSWVESRGLALYAYSCVRRGQWRDALRVNWRNRWAETRQAMATLIALGAGPRETPRGFPTGQAEIQAFIRGLEWHQPWSAAAQVSHLLFFLRHSELPSDGRSEALSAILECLADLESPETGGWYRGNVSREAIVNGAMKVLSGFAWWELSPRYGDSLVRTVLDDATVPYDCALYNRLYVINKLRPFATARAADVRKIARQSIDAVRSFQQEDGGLASNPNGALKRYYFAPVSRGLPVCDIHGLCVLSLSLGLASSLLDRSAEFGWTNVES